MSKNKQLNFQNHTPAVLKENKHGTYIEYTVINPYTEVMDRKRIKLDRKLKPYKKQSVRRQKAYEMIADLNNALNRGWTPFQKEMNQRRYTALHVCIDEFMKFQERELELGEKRKDTLRDYRSQTRILKDWLANHFKRPDIFVSTFTDDHAFEYVEWRMNRGKKPLAKRTHGNIITFCRTLYNWFNENRFCNENPFRSVNYKSNYDKTKIRKQIKDVHLNLFLSEAKENNFGFYIAMLLLLHGIRRTELTKLKFEHINLKKRIILIPEEVAKMGYERPVTITNLLMNVLIEYSKIHNPKATDFIVGHNFIPNAKPIYPNTISDLWAKYRQKLKLPMHYQFYSLRDTGAIQLMKKGIAMNQITMQFGHQNYSITAKYTLHANYEGDTGIKQIESFV